MNRHNRHRLWVALLGLALAPSLWADAAAPITGKAHDLDSGEFLYTEHHSQLPPPANWRVDYVGADGEAFAYKTLDYRAGEFTPVYQLEYTASPRRYGVKRGEQGLVMYHTREAPPAEPQTAPLPASASLVVDGGFDHFVRHHWDSLRGGETQELTFAFANRLKTLPLRIRAVDIDALPFTPDDPTRQFFVIEADSLFLRWMMSPIYLAYDQRQRLVLYRGQSNVRVNGEAVQVAIRYEYRDESVRGHTVALSQ